MPHILPWPWRRPRPSTEGLKESRDALHEAQRREFSTAAALRRRDRETVKNHFAQDIKRAFGIG
jgi:hypothetical protein